MLDKAVTARRCLAWHGEVRHREAVKSGRVESRSGTLWMVRQSRHGKASPGMARQVEAVREGLARLGLSRQGTAVRAVEK